MASSNNTEEPIVCRDPRFIAGRQLIGQAAAVELYASLLQQVREQYGPSSIESAPAYLQYGKALFWDRSNSANEKTEDARTTAAEAAERRLAAATTTTEKEGGDSKPAAVKRDAPDENGSAPIANDNAATNSSPVNEDVLLALEMMETAWSIMDDEQADAPKYQQWLISETPRVLSGIADVLSALNRHADAADAYLRALELRQNLLQAESPQSVDTLKARRLIVELNVLIAQELLACDPQQDVVTTESETTLVKAGQVVEYARGYYDKARDELQETVLLMGKLAAKNADVKEEKENICFAATMVMGVGTTLAQMDEEGGGNSSSSPTAKKLKTDKS